MSCSLCPNLFRFDFFTPYHPARPGNDPLGKLDPELLEEECSRSRGSRATDHSSPVGERVPNSGRRRSSVQTPLTTESCDWASVF